MWFLFPFYSLHSVNLQVLSILPSEHIYYLYLFFLFWAITEVQIMPELLHRLLTGLFITVFYEFLPA